MATPTIEVAPLPDSQESVLSAVSLSHKGCRHLSISKHRDVLTDVYTLRCPCGLEISFPQIGVAAATILDVAIRGLPTVLDTGTFLSTTETKPVHLAPPGLPESAL